MHARRRPRPAFGGASGEEIKSATLRRRMVPLVATVNLAIEEGKLTFNPFIGWCLIVMTRTSARHSATTT